MVFRAPIRIHGLLVAACLLLLAGPAPAARFTQGGIGFSDELGGFTLVSVTGTGRHDDPFVLIERIHGDGPAILTIRGLGAPFGNRVRTNHVTGFAMVKIAINDTGQTWSSFSMELQEILDRESPYGDGLSFGQGNVQARAMSADLYDRVSAIHEPRDGVLFSEGFVGSGDRVAFRFLITDNTPRDEFFLIQRRQEPIAASPPVGRHPAEGRDYADETMLTGLDVPISSSSFRHRR